MARIVYKPHCSECGAVINDEVMYKKIKLEVEKGMDWRFGDEYTNIYPTRCKSCGEYFNYIEIKLPADLTGERL